MSIQNWHTLVRSEYQKCNFPTAVDDRLQRDIFIIGLNDTFKPFRSDVIARKNLSTLSFTQVIAKARDFEAGLKTESPSQNTTSRKQPTRSPLQLIIQSPHITPVSVSRTGSHALQVPRPAFSAGAHHMPPAAGSLETGLPGYLRTHPVRSCYQSWS